VDSHDLVLARHEEDISWSKSVPQEFTLYVYETTSKLFVSKKDYAWFQPVKSPDAGLEAGSYLRHIIDRYALLADYTVFSQAQPHDHMPGSYFPNKLAEYLAALEDTKNRFYPFGMLTDEIAWTSGLSSRARRMPCNPVAEKSTEFPLMPFKKKFLPDNQTLLWKFPYGAIFGVSKRLILKHSKSFYEDIYEWCAYAPYTRETAILERVWPQIFEG